MAEAQGKEAAAAAVSRVMGSRSGQGQITTGPIYKLRWRTGVESSRGRLAPSLLGWRFDM